MKYFCYIVVLFSLFFLLACSSNDEIMIFTNKNVCYIMHAIRVYVRFVKSKKTFMIMRWDRMGRWAFFFSSCTWFFFVSAVFVCSAAMQEEFVLGAFFWLLSRGWYHNIRCVIVAQTKNSQPLAVLWMRQNFNCIAIGLFCGSCGRS